MKIDLRCTTRALIGVTAMEAERRFRSWPLLWFLFLLLGLLILFILLQLTRRSRQRMALVNKRHCVCKGTIDFLV